MSFTEAIASCFRRYVGFSGRASRSEFWYFELFAVLLSIAGSIIDPRVVGGLISLALLLPSLAVTARRLHDTNRSGWWILIAFIPLVGIIVLIIWLATRGESNTNRFGPPPFAAPTNELAPAPSAAGGGGETDRMKCPRCGESIAASARQCRFCGLEFPPAVNDQ